jgi:sugar phosphate permease
MASLILAGESIFLPAFGLNRYFKTPFMAALGVTEQQIGEMFVVYGSVATICYLLGGPLADRFAPRWLMAGSLVATGCGSIYMATLPSLTAMKWLFGFWGASTILAFWPAMIRATHDWGHHDQQGRAFGWLDGGRGALVAAINLVCALSYSWMIGAAASASLEQQATVVARIAWAYAGCNFVAALGVLLFVRPETQAIARSEPPSFAPRWTVSKRLGKVLSQRAVWLQAAVIIAAYSAFKMMDNYGLYAEDAYGFSDAESAILISVISYVRVFAAIGAGFVADRLLGVRRTISLCFMVLATSYVLFLALPPAASLWLVMAINMAASSLGFFALRGIYFALIEDTGTPHHLTGTAVGVICFVGFLPEIYMGILTGWLISSARAAGDVLVGYRQCFWFLLAMSIVGLAASWLLKPHTSRSTDT